MKFPYGLSDFGALIRDGYWYQDRTERIPLLEDAGRQLLFIRPRRFGKSLLLSMLEHYYDINRADAFDALFGALAIGRDPTPLRNRYVVMKWDFSVVKAHGTVRELEAALHQHLNDCIQAFVLRYRERLAQPVTIHPENALSSWASVLMAVSNTPHRLYLLIDEYDNFANEVLMADRDDSRDRYEALLHGEGALKTVFKAVKAAAGGLGLERVFITGVSPVVLSDLTSGYNVAKNLYLAPRFNDLCGLRETEVLAVLERLAADAGPALPWTPTGALETMRTFYNGYRFSEEATDSVYNPTLTLYFLDALQTDGQPPSRLLDENLAMDRHKLRYIAALPHGEALLIEALDPTTAGVVIPQLARRFGVEEMLNAVKDPPFMASLLYFFGILTLEGLTPFGDTALRIPNLVARALYVERLRETWLPTYEDRTRHVEIRRELCQRGDPMPLIHFIETRYFAVLSNRDYRWTNELVIKLAFLTLLLDDRLYMAVSELETGRGYVDLALIVRPEKRRFQALDLLLEFKYVGLKELGLDAAALRALSREELAALPAVAAKLDEAATQARRYGAELTARHGLRALHALAVVAIGLERVAWRAVDLDN